MGLTRRIVLAAGAAAAATAALPRAFAQQASKAGTGKFYEKGPVRIHYEQQREAGTGLLIVDANGAFFVELASSSFARLLSKCARQGGRCRCRGACCQYDASG